MSTQAIQKTSEGNIEFTPFGAADKIKLSINIVKNFVAIPTKSGAICGDRDAMRFIMLCQAQRLNPFAGDAFLTGYDGRNGPQFSLITAHVAFMKRAESCNEFEGMESGIILRFDDGNVTEREGDFHLSEENVVGGWARVYRKGRKPTYRRLSIEQRKPAYDSPFWQGAKAAEQIVKCAEADALRATFPTLLGGLHLAGEMVEVESVVMPTPGIEAVPVAAKAQPKPVEDAKAESAAGLAPAEVVSPGTPTGPCAELADALYSSGITFDNFKSWAEKNCLHEDFDTDNVNDFSEVKPALAKRLLRNVKGLIQQLKEGVK
jgi:phage recombination protein Bet